MRLVSQQLLMQGTLREDIRILWETLQSLERVSDIVIDMGKGHNEETD